MKRQEVSVEAALEKWEQPQKEVGKQKTFVQVVERLLPQIGLTANIAGEEKSISIADQCVALYDAGLYELGDTCLREAVEKYAKMKNIQYVRVGDNRVKDYDTRYKNYQNSSHLKICSLRKFNGTVPDSIICSLREYNKKTQRQLYVIWSEKNTDPWIMLRIPEKNKCWRWFHCVEVMRWAPADV